MRLIETLAVGRCSPAPASKGRARHSVRAASEPTKVRPCPGGGKDSGRALASWTAVTGVQGSHRFGFGIAQELESPHDLRSTQIQSGDSADSVAALQNLTGNRTPRETEARVRVEFPSPQFSPPSCLAVEELPELITRRATLNRSAGLRHGPVMRTILKRAVPEVGAPISGSWAGSANAGY